MVWHVMENVRPAVPHQFILMVLTDHLTSEMLCFPKCLMIGVPRVTDGAARTVLMAKHHINNDDPLLIVNSDQLIEWDIDSFLGWSDDFNGGIATFTSTAPQYSYVKTSQFLVTEVAEKKVISDHATAGAYYWKRGRDFVRSAEAMIAADDRTNGEFYVSPTYNYAIRDGLRITSYPVKKVHALGTPEDLKTYLEELERG